MLNKYFKNIKITLFTLNPIIDEFDINKGFVSIIDLLQLYSEKINTNSYIVEYTYYNISNDLIEGKRLSIK